MRPWLSILIPVYDVAPYLGECLSSVLSQRLEGVEVIAVDDRSTDGSLALLERAAATSPHPIRVLRHERNRGVSVTRNTLLDAASGDYVWFLDADDAFAEGVVARLRAVVDAHEPDLVLCDFSRFTASVSAPAGGRAIDPRIATFAGEPRLLRFMAVKCPIAQFVCHKLYGAHLTYRNIGGDFWPTRRCSIRRSE